MRGALHPAVRLLLPALSLGAVASIAVVVALGAGPGSAGLDDLLEVLSGGGTPSARAILLEVRLPRIVLAAMVGAALSAAGAAYQAILRNPLADPFILGISGGAALGAVLFTALAGNHEPGPMAGRPLAAFAGAVGTLFLLFRLARVRGRTATTPLLLVGVVLNAFDSAVILALLTAGDPARFQGVLLYLVGALGWAPWESLAAAAVLVAAGLAVVWALSHCLNLLALGEEQAATVGVPVERTVWAVLLAASLPAAAATALVGLVGFVGLIVPHAVRVVFGPDHRVLVPASAVGGAAFLLLADTLARTAMAPAELPVGVITACAGGPFFLVLYLRRLREG